MQTNMAGHRIIYLLQYTILSFRDLILPGRRYTIVVDYSLITQWTIGVEIESCNWPIIVGKWILFMIFVPDEYSSMAWWTKVATKTTVSPQIGLNMLDVATALASPLCAFWKNNMAIVSMMIFAKNLFFDGYYIDCQTNSRYWFWSLPLGSHSMWSYRLLVDHQQESLCPCRQRIGSERGSDLGFCPASELWTRTNYHTIVKLLILFKM